MCQNRGGTAEVLPLSSLDERVFLILSGLPFWVCECYNGATMVARVEG